MDIAEFVAFIAIWLSLLVAGAGNANAIKELEKRVKNIEEAESRNKTFVRLDVPQDMITIKKKKRGVKK
jgi:hypothetical protein